MRVVQPRLPDGLLPHGAVEEDAVLVWGRDYYGGAGLEESGVGEGGGEGSANSFVGTV